MLTRNACVDKNSASEFQPPGNKTVEGPRRVNLNEGVRIEEPLNATPNRAAVPRQSDNTEKRKATTSEKGKGHVTEATKFQNIHANGLPCNNMFEAAQTSTKAEVEAFRRTYVAEVWQDLFATEMTLGRQQGRTILANKGTETARALNFGVTMSQQSPVEDKNLRLTLYGASIATTQSTILTLSSSDSSSGTPNSPSTSISFSTEELMDT